MAQYGFAFNAAYCNGCKTCMLACKDRYDLDGETNFRRVFEYGGGKAYFDENGLLANDCFGYYLSISCNHCDDPACVKVCPTAAMTKDAETGLVHVDESRCIGCAYCEMACPYGNPSISAETGHSHKCTGCIDRVKEGKSPICVEACPQRALRFGKIDELREQFGGDANIAPLPDSSYTSPNFVIAPCSQTRPSGDAEGRILNPPEVM